VVSGAYDPVPVLVRVVWAEHPTEPIEDPDDLDVGTWVETMAGGGPTRAGRSSEAGDPEVSDGAGGT